jgi:dihydrofolate reductase
MRCVLCMDQRGGIGRNNTLPWSIPADLARFKSLTTKGTVVMGSNTFFSLPNHKRPLPDRRSIVVSRNPNDAKFDEYRNHPRLSVTTIDAAALTDESILIGGAQLYQALFERIRILHLSVVHAVFDCDTYIYIDFSNWTVLHQETLDDHTYYVLKKTAELVD